ncbi:SLR1-related LCR [Medicago truncatula]|uniref:SLR1-related LCR n=1 Tax=Medicago truncatula TaxID=3880 RepID=A0A072V7X8_MEDTR|nr:SLR1-related LCR [Medicago truncatula]
MVIILFTFSAIALTSDGCITILPGDCIMEACRQWCHDNYQGHGYCVPTHKNFDPKYICFCNHIIKCYI